MPDKEILEAIEQRINQAHLDKADEELTQAEWDREYLFGLFMVYLKEAIVELISQGLVLGD
jgi:vacuolar-type H+-ATPase subunit E/Vma4